MGHRYTGLCNADRERPQTRHHYWDERMFPVAYDTIFESKAAGRGRGGPRPVGQLITVVVTLYNYANFIAATLDDVATQTHGPIELIVIDDVSQDGSVAVVQQWMNAHRDRFEIARLARNQVNQGLAQSRNLAFSLATSEYVFVLDADNGLYPRALARLLEALLNTGKDGAYCQLEHFGDETTVGCADVWNRDYFRLGNYVDAMALVKTAAWAAVGGYSYMDVVGWEDYDFWCKFIAAGLECVFVPEILCRYRVHGMSMLRIESNPKSIRLHQEMLLRHPHMNFRFE